MRRKLTEALVLFCLIGALTFACGDQRMRSEINVERGLFWLPTDTETLLVASKPFWMSNFLFGSEEDKNRALTAEELEKQFEGFTLGLFNLKDGILDRHLERKRVLFALEGSRHFRAPQALGELPFEGCQLAVFADDLRESRDAFLKDAGPVAARMEEIEGQMVAVFEQKLENDLWTIYVSFPQNNVVLVATNRSFLQVVLVRMRGKEGQRALPDSLPEWKYVNRNSQFWGIRHFDRTQAKMDPSSPFRDRQIVNVPDDQAIGLIYQSDPSSEKKMTLTYLSGDKAKIGKIEEARFPNSLEPENVAGLHIQYRELETGVIKSTYDLSYSRPVGLFWFVFAGDMGHAVFI